MSKCVEISDETFEKLKEQLLADGGKEIVSYEPYGDSCSCGCNVCLKISEPKYSEHFASYAEGVRETIAKVKGWINEIKNDGKIAYHNELDLLIDKLDSELKPTPQININK